MQRLSGLDAMYLYLETPSQPLNVCCIVELDTSAGNEDYTFDGMVERLAPRLAAIPEFRQRLGGNQLNLDHPVWVDSATVEIRRHVRRAALPTPGGDPELGELCAHLASLPLDRKHPMWEMWVIENPWKPERLHLMLKAHHAVVDGVGGANIMAQLCTTEPNAPELPIVVGEDSPGSMMIAADGLLGIAKRPWRLAGVIPATGVTVLRSIQRARTGRTMAAPFAAPATTFNAPHSGRRSVAFTMMNLDDVKTVKNRHGATVNDVVMAVCAGALRRFLAARNELPTSPLVAAVPVSVHGESDRGGRNQTSYMFCRLEAQTADPVSRLHSMTRGIALAKEHSEVLGPSLLQDWAELVGQITMGAVKLVAPRLPVSAGPPFNLIMSNVPGPQIRLYVAGYEAKKVIPLGPILAGAGLNITVMSYNGTVGVGILSSPDLVPDLWELADAFPAALQELLD